MASLASMPASASGAVAAPRLDAVGPASRLDAEPAPTRIDVHDCDLDVADQVPPLPPLLPPLSSRTRPSSTPASTLAWLQRRRDQARAFVWMHSRVAYWARVKSHVVAGVQMVGASGTATILSAGGGNQAFAWLGTAVSSLVLGVTVVGKVAQFDVVVAENVDAIHGWNKLWAKLDTALQLHAAHEDPVLLESVNDSFAALADASEKLPPWVRRQCAAAWGRDASTRDMLPDMCRDATIN